MLGQIIIIQKYLIGTKNSSKGLSQCVQDLCGNKTKNKNIKLIDIENKTIKDNKLMANLFCEYFTSVGKNYGEKIKTPSQTKSLLTSQKLLPQFILLK